MTRKILVIEDNVAEAIYGQAELARAGITDFQAVTTLSEGLNAMPNFDALLTDLFFPAGETQTQQYTDRFLPVYEAYKERRFKVISKDNLVTRAVEQVAEAFSVTPQKYVEELMPQFNSPETLIKAARDAIYGRKDFQRFQKFLKIEQGIRDGTALPLGIIAVERAKELKMPAVIVTSTYHHDDAYEPIKSLITVPAFDTLIEGRKNWKAGIESILR